MVRLLLALGFFLCYGIANLLPDMQGASVHQVSLTTCAIESSVPSFMLFLVVSKETPAGYENIVRWMTMVTASAGTRCATLVIHIDLLVHSGDSSLSHLVLC